LQQHEYIALQRVEREHWFYKGKRELVLWWLRNTVGKPKPGELLLDAGAGTGEFVKELRSNFPGAQVRGIEYESTARAIAQEMNSVILEEGSILDLPVVTSSALLATALDVLEHVEDDTRALNELIRVTKKGGVIITNVPASPLLWSDWDVTLGHHRRYTMASFKELLLSSTGEFEVVHLAYINSLVFLPVLAVRAYGRFFKRSTRMEDKIPPQWLNRFLKASFTGPARWKWFRPPFGVSIFCVLRKR